MALLTFVLVQAELVGLLPGDSALVFDNRQSRFTVVTPEMTLGRMWTQEQDGESVALYPQGLLEGGLIVGTARLVFSGELRTGRVDDRSGLYLADVSLPSSPRLALLDAELLAEVYAELAGGRQAPPPTDSAMA